MDIINQVQQGTEQGVINQAQLEELNKTISAGYGYIGKPTELQYGGVIQMESLEATLKSVTFDMKHLNFWPAVSIDKARNLIEQYNRLVGYGSDVSPYIGEGGAPQETDSYYIRDAKKVIFFATRRKVTHQMMLVDTSIGDVVAQQAKEGTLSLLERIEREMYWGNAHFISSTLGTWTGSPSDVPSTSISLDGVLIQLQFGDTDVQARSLDFEGYGEFGSIARNLNGYGFTQDDLETLAVITEENFGRPDQLHVQPRALSAFTRRFYPQFRSEPGLANQIVGYSINKMTTSIGDITFKPSLFLRPKGLARANGTSASAPAIVVGATANGALTGTLVPGVYYYYLTAVNDFGEGVPVSATRTVGAAESSVQITITSATTGTKYINVYRTAVGATDATTSTFIGRYKFTGNGMTIKDAGAKMPGLGEAYFMDMSPEVMKFKQLLPLTKINFAIVTTAIEFGIVLYGTLMIFAPRKMGYFYNLGTN